jgi:hypothetical protein
MVTVPPYLQISQQKLKERAAQIPTEYLLTPEQLSQLNSQHNITHLPRSEEFFTPAEITIINSSAPTIVAKTSAGEWSVQEVTETFIKAAMIAHQAVYRPSLPVSWGRVSVAELTVAAIDKLPHRDPHP